MARLDRLLHAARDAAHRHRVGPAAKRSARIGTGMCGSSVSTSTFSRSAERAVQPSTSATPMPWCAMASAAW
jgi:hypothetical protein